MLYFRALRGNHVALFWFLLIFMTILECTIEVVQPWFLGNEFQPHLILARFTHPHVVQVIGRHSMKSTLDK
jgi:hypothetical protein